MLWTVSSFGRDCNACNSAPNGEFANQAKFTSTSVTTPPLTTLQAAPTTCSHFLETKAAADRLHPRPNKAPPQSVSQWEKLTTWWQRCDIALCSYRE